MPALVRTLFVDPRGVGEAAGYALGDIGGEDAVRELNRAKSFADDRKLRDACRHGLANLGPRAHGPLLQIIGDWLASESERADALRSLFELRYPVSDLAPLAVSLILDDPSEHLRKTALEVLEAVDIDARRAVVLPLLRNTDLSTAEYRHPHGVSLNGGVLLQRLRERLERS